MNKLSVEDRLMTRNEAADYLRVSPSTLAGWACKRPGHLSSIGKGKLTRYRKSDLDKFMAQS